MNAKISFMDENGKETPITFVHGMPGMDDIVVIDKMRVNGVLMDLDHPLILGTGVKLVIQPLPAADVPITV